MKPQRRGRTRCMHTTDQKAVHTVAAMNRERGCRGAAPLVLRAACCVTAAASRHVALPAAAMLLVSSGRGAASAAPVLQQAGPLYPVLMQQSLALVVHGESRNRWIRRRLFAVNACNMRMLVLWQAAAGKWL